MFTKIKKNLVFRFFSFYLALNMIFPPGMVNRVYALTGGPKQPEFNSFTPIETSNMVNLSSGNFNYNIPIMDVGGYPINLAYDSGVTTDQEATWVGLGWNLNVGQINRTVRGLPDDFNGDEMIYRNNLKKNVTVGTNFNISPDAFGIGEFGSVANIGLGIQYNNYNGITFSHSLGISFKLSESVSIGMDLSSTTTEGVSVTPSISLTHKFKTEEKKEILGKGSASLTFNSRQGLTSLNLSSTLSGEANKKVKEMLGLKEKDEFKGSSSIGGSISMNDNILFTPTKRIAMDNNSLTFSAAVGGTIFGINGKAKIIGYGSVQEVANKESKTNAYGYEFTEKGAGKGKAVLDYNRENDQNFSKNTTVLPITNYTYDRYSIEGQGIRGGFRPYRSQVGFVSEPFVSEAGSGVSDGIEIEAGWNVATGVDMVINTSNSHTGNWSDKNDALNSFENHPGTNIDYEKVYFRNEGEINVDRESNQSGLFIDRLGGNSPIRFDINGSEFSRRLRNIYKDSHSATLQIPSNGIKRSSRLMRNQAIQKISQSDAINDPFVETNSNAKSYHTVGFKIYQNNGSTYIYGKALYNKKKVEKTFAVSDNPIYDTSGLVSYSSNDNTEHNDKGVNHFFNSVETPAYAHSFLLTGIISSDYVDLTGDGMTDDDLGTYTKITYENNYDYQWRVPFAENMASFNPGFYSHDNDQKGNYIYGEREQTYVSKIETKNNIAIFHLSNRYDAYGVKGENGGLGTNSFSKKLDSIELFSKSEYLSNPNQAVPLKTAHFEYDYSLMEGVKNNINFINGTGNNTGKLTLKKVYFTYKNSNMGRYTPYIFEYGQIDSDGDGIFDEVFNPPYNLKAYDIWGNYKKNDNSNGKPTNSEFPYVEQNKEKADKNVTAWSLTTINLPSGGKVEMQYESDEYQFVQNKRVMQLFQVVGAGTNAPPASSDITHELYNRSGLIGKDYKYLYIRVPDGYNKNDFVRGITNDPIYFKFLLQMHFPNPQQYDYVSGYFKIDNGNDINITEVNGEKILSIPMKFLDMEGGAFWNSNREVNPISKAGWYFGRKNMNRIVYSLGGDYANDNLSAIVNDLVGSMGTILSIFKGPNKELRDNNCARYFNPKKSWIRLLNPAKRKLGGGLRVKKIVMHDNWDVMTSHPNNSLYKQFYGQEYNYDNDDGTTSGVATFEPNNSHENPLVMPFYSKDDYLVAPKEMNFVEKPFGASFFPAPTVTYGQVTVRNLSRDGISKHATGHIVNKFYTSYDFPTITTFTDLKSHYDKSTIAGRLLNFNARNFLTMSQGFVIEINDMNGKQKSQWVYAENQEAPISGVEYEYSVNNQHSTQLENTLPVIDKNGNISEKSIGVQYDVINDFRESYSEQKTYGININVAGFLAAVFPVVVPTPLPKYSNHRNLARVATTTKLVKKYGILTKKTVYDLGSSVSTENLAWDKNTGRVLVTKTKNEFNDAYYTLKYPAYWHKEYSGMMASTKNLNLTGQLEPVSGSSSFKLINATSDNLIHAGDELIIYINGNYERVWVIGDINARASNITLMNRQGEIINDCPNGDNSTVDTIDFKIVRSGYRNQQMTDMANITTMVNPIYENNHLRSSIPAFNTNRDKIVNAGAVEFSDFWSAQCENHLPYFKVDKKIYNDKDNVVNEQELLTLLDKYNINPYIYNLRGQWRPKRSYTYLTTRDNHNSNPRTSGYFKNYKPFYKKQTNWPIDRNKWTFTSQVTQYSPYGMEIEDRDALGRYSSAQYGYKYTLPTAITSNAEYKEMGFDGFEDYSENLTNEHFNFHDVVVNDPNAEISEKHSHTGQRSIRIKSGQSIMLEKQLNNCEPLEVPDCQSDNGKVKFLPDNSKPVFVSASGGKMLSIQGVYTYRTIRTNSDYFIVRGQNVYFVPDKSNKKIPTVLKLELIDDNNKVIGAKEYQVNILKK